MKKISIGNYIKVFILCVVTVFVVLLLANVYVDKRQYERANEDVMSFLDTIKYDEMDEYLIENASGFIYISSSSDATLDSFELKLKTFILENELEEDFAYFDSNHESVNIYDKLKTSYYNDSLSKDTKLDAANLFAVHNGKVLAVLAINSDTVSIEDVMEFVQRFGVVE